jgi:hypothetical protein
MMYGLQETPGKKESRGEYPSGKYGENFLMTVIIFNVDCSAPNQPF